MEDSGRCCESLDEMDVSNLRALESSETLELQNNLGTLTASAWPEGRRALQLLGFLKQRWNGMQAKEAKPRGLLHALSLACRTQRKIRHEGLTISAWQPMGIRMEHR